LIDSLQIKQLYNIFINVRFWFIYLIFFIWQILEIKWKKSLSHKMCYTPGIFYNIFHWEFFLERDISMIFCEYKHMIIILCY
jgi:hypothetical protein